MDLLAELQKQWDNLWNGDQSNEAKTARINEKEGGAIETAAPVVYGVKPEPSWYDQIQTWLGSGEPTVQSPEASVKPKGGADWLLIGAGAAAVYLAIKE